MLVPSSLRQTWRSLARTPVFAMAAGLTLLIGLASATTIAAIVEGILLRPLPYGDPGRLVGAWHDMPPLGLFHTQQAPGTYFTYQKLATTIAGIGVYQEGAVNFSAPEGTAPLRLSAAFVTRSVLPVLAVAPVLGRNFTEAEDLPKGPDAVILSEGLWRTTFGATPNIVGRTIQINGRSRTVVGVMPRGFDFPRSGTQLWIPLQLDPSSNGNGGFGYNGVARLKPGVSIAAAERDFAAVLPRITQITPNLAPGVSWQMVLAQAKPRPLLVPLRQDMTRGIARTLWLIAAAAGLVLVVACTNVTNLLLVRADGRQRELALREALGAGRLRVLLHFLGESLLLSVVAGLAGLVLAMGAIRAVVAAAPPEIPRLAEVHIDATVVVFTASLVLAVALVCSMFPALRIGGADVASMLRQGGRGGTARRVQQRLRGALVAVQIAFALVALAGSGLLVRTFRQLLSVRPGFAPDHVATLWMSLPSARYARSEDIVRFYSQLTERTTALPGVTAAGLTSHLPLEMHGMNQNPVYREGDVSAASTIPPLEIYSSTDGGYFHAMGIPIVAGRTFDAPDRQRSDEAIISLQTAVRFWGDSTGQVALGKRFRQIPGAPWYTVVGVTGDTRDTALAAPPTRMVYFPEVVSRDSVAGQTARSMALVVRTTGEPGEIVRPIQQIVHDLDPTLPTYDVRTMPDIIRGSTAQLSLIMFTLGGAAVVALLLGAVGLYGVLSYVVTLRTRELGVRLALGASPRAIAAMMTRQGLILSLVGIAGGLAIFAGAARFLRSLLYGVVPGDPVTLVGASLALVVIALAASWIPAQRAARLDPAESLRAE